MEINQSRKRIYLDQAAATPLWPEVVALFTEKLSDVYGNASAIHDEGRVAANLLRAARQEVVTNLGLRPQQLVFTSGGTESNNLALVGLVEKLKNTGRPYESMEILATPIEHPSIINTLNYLERLGVKIVWLAVDSVGQINLEDLRLKISNRSILLTTSYVNSEIGTIATTSRLARILEKERKSKEKIWFHLDAAQAPLWLPCDLSRLKVDLLTLDAGKFGGPKGVGVLAWRGEVPVASLLQGGGQENGLRPGTENVLGALCLARALTIAQTGYENRAEKVSQLRDYFWQQVKVSGLPVQLNGDLGEGRVANNLNFSLLNYDTEYCVVYLDKLGVAASTKSACAGVGSGISQVVSYISEGDLVRSRSTLRFTLGEEISFTDIDYTVESLKKFVTLMSQTT